MRQQNYGRIIVVSSAAGLYGNFGQTAYSAVKMGLVGFANTLAIEGAKQNILTNVIAPIAGSRMTETVLPPELVAALKPEYVSPLVQYLAHDSNKQNGAIFEVGAGWVSRVRWERTKGVSFPLQKFSVDDIAREINKINDFKDANHPTSNADIFPLIMANIDRARDEAYKAEASAPAATAAPAKTGKLNPNVDLKRALAHPMPTLPHTYTERDVMLYALGIGAAADQLDQSELKFVYEGHADFQAFPTFGVVIPSATLGHLASIQGLTFNPMMQVHGEQFMELRKPLPTSGTLTSHPRIVNLYDKGSGALLVLEVSSKDASGEEVIFNQFSLFIRGLGGFGGEKGPATISYDPPKDTAPEVVHREKTLANQAILYRLSGDMNPLHIDVELAKTGNFPKPILHGLCSFGYASRAVVKHFANNDGRRFKSVRARFASPVFPGETLVTEMWRAPNNPNRILFRARVAERGVVVINGAYIDLHPETAATAAPVAKPAAAASAPAPAAAPAGTFLAEGVFAQLSKQASPELVAKIKAVFRFDIENATGVKRSWLLDLKNGSGSIRDASDADKADCTIVIKDKDFVALMAGKLNAQSACQWSGARRSTRSEIASCLPSPHPLIPVLSNLSVLFLSLSQS